MSLTLDNHLDSLFNYGLKVIRANKIKILSEWTNMKQNFKQKEKRSSETIALSFDLFSEALFNEDLSKDDLLKIIKENWEQKIDSEKNNQFILTIIESSIHHATKSNSVNQYAEHQAIEYVFTQINEYILASDKVNSFTYDLFLQHLVQSQQLPIEWVGVIVKDAHSYKLNKCFSKEKSLLPDRLNLESDTIYGLTEKLLNYVPYSRNNKLLTIPFEDKQLLLSTEIGGTVQITSFINHALQLLQSGKDALQTSRQKQQWKDAVLMFNESIIRTRTFDDALEAITEGFVKYLPFERSAIFSYSKIDELGFGLSAYHVDRTEIQSITENIGNLPLISSGLKRLATFGTNLKYLQPLYISNAKNEFPKEYVDYFQMESIVVAPIYTSSSNELLGAAIIDQGPNQSFTLTQDVYTALLKFGQSAGEVLEKFHSSIHELNEVIHFSPREIEVLELIAEGESTTGAADVLHLSEYTVRDYITSVMQKMKARNRTEAVARAIRKGVI